MARGKRGGGRALGGGDGSGTCTDEELAAMDKEVDDVARDIITKGRKPVGRKRIGSKDGSGDGRGDGTNSRNGSGRPAGGRGRNRK